MIKKAISEAEFTFFDTETTGLNPAGGDRIIELAGIRVGNGNRIAVFHTLVNPLRPVSEGAFKVNHISDDMLRDAPRVEDILPAFLKFSEGSCLCSYNAPFDIGFLDSEMILTGSDPGVIRENAVLDVLRMARRLMPGLERYALWFVADALGIRTQQEHRALSDVEMTIDVFDKLNAILTDKGVVGYAQLVHLFAVSGRHLENARDQRCSQVQEAIDAGAALSIRYLSSFGAEVTERRIIPKEIRQDKQGGFVIAHCCMRNEDRIFRINGILDLEVV